MDQVYPTDMLRIYWAHTEHNRFNIITENQKNFENITFLPIIYKTVTKNPKTLRKSEKRWAKEKGNSNLFY